MSNDMNNSINEHITKIEKELQEIINQLTKDNESLKKQLETVNLENKTALQKCQDLEKVVKEDQIIIEKENTKLLEDIDAKMKAITEYAKNKVVFEEKIQKLTEDLEKTGIALNEENKKNEELKKQVVEKNKIAQELEDLKQKNDLLNKKKIEVDEDNKKMAQQIVQLKEENGKLKEENGKLKSSSKKPVPVCNSNHPLKFWEGTNTYDEYTKLHPEVEGLVAKCDKCGSLIPNSQDKVWHCSDCGYDGCINCFPIQ